MSGKLLGRHDEPQANGAVVAVRYGDYQRQEIWVASGANIGNWYPLGGEFGRQPGTIPLHPDWRDVLARGPVTLLTPGDEATYQRGWRAGRRDLWQSMEDLTYEDPPPGLYERTDTQT